MLNDPHDLTFGPDGRLHVADKFASSISVLDPETMDIVDVIGEGQLFGIRYISFGTKARAAVAATGLGVVVVFEDLTIENPQLSFVLQVPGTEGTLIYSNGNMYTMAGDVGSIIAYSPGGDLIGEAGNHVGAHDIAEDPEGNIWVADNFNRRLVKYSPDLKQLQSLDDAKYGFIGPRYVDFDRFGRIAVADQGLKALKN